LHEELVMADVAPASRIRRKKCRQSDGFVTIAWIWNGKVTGQKMCGRILGEIRPLANPVWGRGGVGT